MARELRQLPVYPELRASPRPGEAEVLELTRLLDEPWVARDQRAALTDRERLRRMEGEDLTGAASAEALAVRVRRAEAGRRVDYDRQVPLGGEILPGADLRVADAEHVGEQDAGDPVAGALQDGTGRRGAWLPRVGVDVDEPRPISRPQSSLGHRDEGERRHQQISVPRSGTDGGVECCDECQGAIREGGAACRPGPRYLPRARANCRSLGPELRVPVGVDNLVELLGELGGLGKLGRMKGISESIEPPVPNLHDRCRNARDDRAERYQVGQHRGASADHDPGCERHIVRGTRPDADEHPIAETHPPRKVRARADSHKQPNVYVMAERQPISPPRSTGISISSTGDDIREAHAS